VHSLPRPITHPQEVVIPSEAEESLYFARTRKNAGAKVNKIDPAPTNDSTLKNWHSAAQRRNPPFDQPKIPTRSVISTEAADSSIVRCAVEKSASLPIQPSLPTKPNRPKGTALAAEVRPGRRHCQGGDEINSFKMSNIQLPISYAQFAKIKREKKKS
jgi:hypothetical protein